MSGRSCPRPAPEKCWITPEAARVAEAEKPALKPAAGRLPGSLSTARPAPSRPPALRGRSQPRDGRRAEQGLAGAGEGKPGTRVGPSECRCRDVTGRGGRTTNPAGWGEWEWVRVWVGVRLVPVHTAPGTAGKDLAFAYTESTYF